MNYSKNKNFDAQEYIGEQIRINTNHGHMTVLIREIEPTADMFKVSGEVLEGSETSRMFHHTHTKDLTGEFTTIYAVSRDSLKRGRHDAAFAG